MDTAADTGTLLRLFEQIVPTDKWRALGGERSVAQIYTLPVVVEMMLLQRLSERGSQQEAVHQLVTGELRHLLPDSKRVREGKVSLATGGYAQACGRVSVEGLEKVCDEALAELGKRMEAAPDLGLGVVLFDGTSLSLEHDQELLEEFPPCENQFGKGHWGILKLVGLHDLRTGIALRPAYGAMYGPDAVSEQQLAEQALQQAPAGCVVLGDGNFGIFSFAYAVVQSQRQVVFRLTKQRAEALGASKLRPNSEQRLCWRPSRFDRRKHPQLPEHAQIEGRLIVVSRNGFRDSLYLFTTLLVEVEKIVALYGLRWNMELDLRTLKRTMRLHHLRGKSRAAVEKELLIAVVGYGLVRAFMAEAARRVALSPRKLSFTRCYGLLNAMSGQLCSEVPEERQQAYNRLLSYMGQSKLPQRSKPRAYPRAVWGFTQAFPRRGPRNGEARIK